MLRKGLVESIDYPGYRTLTRARLLKQLNSTKKDNVDSSAYYYLDDFTGDLSGAERVIKQSKPRNAPQRKPCPVVVTNEITGDVSNWISTEKFAFAVGTNKNTIQKSIGKNNGRWKQYHIAYVKSR